MATDKINKFVQGLNPAKSVLSTDLYGVEAGGSVRLNADLIREGLATSEDLDKAENNIKAVADDLRTQIDEQKEKDTEQDGEIAKKANKSDLSKVATSGSYNDLTDKPTISTDYVQYHASLADADTSKPAVDASGHIFKNTEIVIKKGTMYANLESEDYGIPKGTYYKTEDNVTIWLYNRGIYAVNPELLQVGCMSNKGECAVISADSITFRGDDEDYVVAKTYNEERNLVVFDNGQGNKFGFGMSNNPVTYSDGRWNVGKINADWSVDIKPKVATQDIIIEGGWRDVYPQFDPETLPKVATSGSYDDLSDKPISEGTTSFWNEKRTYIPKKGELVIYTDYQQDEKGNNIPNFKVGDGLAYVVDLPFAGCDYLLKEHMADKSLHHEIGLSDTDIECLIIN